MNNEMVSQNFSANGFFRSKFFKTIVVSCLLLLPALFVAGQKDKPVAPDLPRNEENGQVYYMEVVTMENVDKTELFKRSANWVKAFYKNPGGFIEQADSVNGVLLMKPQFATYRILKNGVKAQSAIVKYTLQVGFKEGRYRYEIKDVNIKAASYLPIEKLFNESDPNMEDNYNTLTEAGKYFTELINNLKESMEEPSVKVKKDEW